MPFTFCEECWARADQELSEATLELDRASRLQDEACDLVEAEAETRAEYVVEEAARDKAETRHAEVEAVIVAEKQHIELLRTIEDGELRLRILQSKLFVERSEQYCLEDREQCIDEELRTEVRTAEIQHETTERAVEHGEYSELRLGCELEESGRGHGEFLTLDERLDAV